jgi:hypothetical protein
LRHNCRVCYAAIEAVSDPEQLLSVRLKHSDVFSEMDSLKGSARS